MAVEKTGKAKDNDAESAEEHKREVEATEAQAGEPGEQKVETKSILGVFKRKKDVPSEDPKSPAQQETEQARSDPQESSDAQSRTGDDSSTKEKNEQE